MPAARFQNESFTEEQLNGVIKELMALQADAEQKIPYAKLREIVDELGIDSKHLDAAIVNHQAKEANRDATRSALLSLLGWGLAAILAVIVCDGWKFRTGVLEPTIGLRKVAAATAQTSAAIPRTDLTEQELARLSQECSLGSSGVSSYFRLTIYNPFDRKIDRILVHIKGYGDGTYFDRDYWVACYTNPLTSDFALEEHHMSGVSITSWSIKKAEFSRL